LFLANLEIIKQKGKKYASRYMGDALPPSWLLMWLSVEVVFPSQSGFILGCPSRPLGSWVLLVAGTVAPAIGFIDVHVRAGSGKRTLDGARGK
jgi:hypothetical protein